MAPGVFRRELRVQATPRAVFHQLYRVDPQAVWLDSLGPLGSNTSVLASGELLCFPIGQALSGLRQVWAELSLSVEGEAPPLGLLTVLPYELAVETMGGNPTPGGEGGQVEPVRAVKVTRSLEFDHHSGRITAWSLSESEEVHETWCRELEQTLVGNSDTQDSGQVGAARAMSWRDDPERYREMISLALDAIRDGEVYQICLTTQVAVSSDILDWQLHDILRESNPSPHQGLIRLGEYTMISSSPETFLRLSRSGEVITRPIKGTRPRGDSQEDDLRLLTELRESDKEQAENLMIVDLMRNDLLRVCESGSIQVSGLFDVETYSSVHQLVSTVSGKLREGQDGIDLIAACFPAGSMTGAPKHRAVELLRRWESGPRGLYSGAWGWLRVDHTLELAMTIRTAVARGTEWTIGVGGGITWSSEPDREIAEVGHKATRLLEALRAPTIHYS